MKTSINIQLHIARISNATFAGTLVSMLAFGITSGRADETCFSPYLLASTARKSSSMFGRSVWKAWAMTRANWSRSM